MAHKLKWVYRQKLHHSKKIEMTVTARNVELHHIKRKLYHFMLVARKQEEALVLIASYDRSQTNTLPQLKAANSKMASLATSCLKSAAKQSLQGETK